MTNEILCNIDKREDQIFVQYVQAAPAGVWCTINRTSNNASKARFGRFMPLTIKISRHLLKTQMTRYLCTLHKKEEKYLLGFTIIIIFRFYLVNLSYHRIKGGV